MTLNEVLLASGGAIASALATWWVTTGYLKEALEEERLKSQGYALKVEAEFWRDFDTERARWRRCYVDLYGKLKEAEEAHRDAAGEWQGALLRESKWKARAEFLDRQRTLKNLAAAASIEELSDVMAEELEKRVKIAAQLTVPYGAAKPWRIASRLAGRIFRIVDKAKRGKLYDLSEDPFFSIHREAKPFVIGFQRPPKDTNPPSVGIHQGD